MDSNEGSSGISTFIFQMIAKLIEALKVVHESGFIYNDLKLENIMINENGDDAQNAHQVRQGAD